MLGKFFGWAEYIGCPPNVIVGWATAHRAVEGGVKGVSYPGPRGNGGAP